MSVYFREIIVTAIVWRYVSMETAIVRLSQWFINSSKHRDSKLSQSFGILSCDGHWITNINKVLPVILSQLVKEGNN